LPQRLEKLRTFVYSICQLIVFFFPLPAAPATRFPSQASDAMTATKGSCICIGLLRAQVAIGAGASCQHTSISNLVTRCSISAKAGAKSDASKRINDAPVFSIATTKSPHEFVTSRSNGKLTACLVSSNQKLREKSHATCKSPAMLHGRPANQTSVVPQAWNWPRNACLTAHTLFFNVCHLDVTSPKLCSSSQLVRFSLSSE